MDNSKWTVKNSQELAYFGVAIGYVGARFAWLISSSFGIIVLILGISIVLFACYLWLKGKNRHWLFMLWGLIAPVGFLGISLLKDKSKTREGNSP